MFLLRVFLLVVLCRSSQQSVLKNTQLLSEKLSILPPKEDDPVSSSHSPFLNRERTYLSPNVQSKSLEKISYSRGLNKANSIQYSDLVFDRSALAADSVSLDLEDGRPVSSRTHNTLMEVPLEPHEMLHGYSDGSESAFRFYSRISEGPYESPLANRMYWLRMWPYVIPAPLPEPLPRGTLPPDAAVCDLCPVTSTGHDPLDPCSVCSIKFFFQFFHCRSVLRLKNLDFMDVNYSYHCTTFG